MVECIRFICHGFLGGYDVREEISRCGVLGAVLVLGMFGRLGNWNGGLCRPVRPCNAGSRQFAQWNNHRLRRFHLIVLKISRAISFPGSGPRQ